MSKENRIVSFADVAHQSLSFDTEHEPSRLVLELLDTPWVQRLRQIRQTGNTNLVYMFAEHSRFGHSVGVAYLATLLMRSLSRVSPEKVQPYANAVAAAAILHDIGHMAPGSHLAERAWSKTGRSKHETITKRVVAEDKTIGAILDSYEGELREQIIQILSEDASLPAWTHAIISGGGWNADRGNWAIVDSAMCAVSYGRYNVNALLESFRIADDGRLVLRENRIDALTHFFVARDSMYRQVYQHRVLQAVDATTLCVVQRLRDLLEAADSDNIREVFDEHDIFADDVLIDVLNSDSYSEQLPLASLFQMTENWWNYHLERWSSAGDDILRDLCLRLRNRSLLKTIRLQPHEADVDAESEDIEDQVLIDKARATALELGFNPDYYVMKVDESDRHRDKQEEAPLVLLENGGVVPVTSIEPMIAKLFERPSLVRRWLVVPEEVKDSLGRHR